MDFEIVKRLLAALEREQVRYAIFGAVAMNLHGLARFTEDLDISVEPEAANIDRDAGQEVPQRRGDEHTHVATRWRSRVGSGHPVGLGVWPPLAPSHIPAWRPEI